MLISLEKRRTLWSERKVIWHHQSGKACLISLLGHADEIVAQGLVLCVR
jgi:hypothetical protein